MKRKFFLILLPVLLALSVGCCFYEGSFRDYGPVPPLWFFGFGIFFLSAFWWIFSRGSFRKSSWVRLAYAGLAFCLTGALFTIQHWPYGSVMLMAGRTLTGLAYIVHFVKKPSKGYLDWVKLVFIVSLFGSVLLTQQDIVFIRLVQGCMFLSGMTLIVSFYVSELRPPAKKPLPLEAEGTHVFKQGE